MLGVLTLCLALSLTVAFPNGYFNGYNGYNNGFGNQYGYNSWYGNGDGYNNWYGNGDGYNNWYGNGDGYNNWYRNGYNNWYGNGNGFDNQYGYMSYGGGDCGNNGWQMYNDHYYCFNRNSMPWYRAQESCRNMNGYLVQIENMEENQWLSNMAGSGSYWMGGYCNGGSCMSGDESWYYGDSQMSYFNWGENNEFYRNGGYGNGNEYCGMFNFYNGGQWWRYMCQRPMMYICEREEQYGGKR